MQPSEFLVWNVVDLHSVFQQCYEKIRTSYTVRLPKLLLIDELLKISSALVQLLWTSTRCYFASNLYEDTSVLQGNRC